jgi:phage shock protein A
MGLGKRLSMIIKAKASKALDRAEDLRETLDYSHQRQLEMLQQCAAGWPTWRPVYGAPGL